VQPLPETIDPIDQRPGKFCRRAISRGCLWHNAPGRDINNDAPPSFGEGGPGAYVSGNVGYGVQGALTGTPPRTIGPKIVAYLDGPASSFEIGVDQATGRTVVWQHSNISGMGVGYGGRRIAPTSFEEQAERRGRAAFGAMTGDVLTRQRYAAEDTMRAKVAALNKANADYWKTGPKA
jgi:hypothetical protein